MASDKKSESPAEKITGSKAVGDAVENAVDKAPGRERAEKKKPDPADKRNPTKE